MKVVMVNDCAHVGETLIKYLPEDFSVLHLKRSRSFFDKTFGVAWRIFRAKGDLYHVYYLLQGCYLAKSLIEALSKLCFPLVLKYVSRGRTGDCHVLHKFLFSAIWLPFGSRCSGWNE